MRVKSRGLQLQRWAATIVLPFLLLAGCTGPRGEMRGEPPSGPVIAVASLTTAAAKGAVTVRGTMVEK